MTADLEADAVRWLLMPLIGSLVACLGAFMFNGEETRRHVIGRCIFAVSAGTLLPRIISLLHPKLQSMAIEPTLLFLMGIIISTFVYVLSRNFMEGFFRRSRKMATEYLDEVERRTKPRAMGKAKSKTKQPEEPETYEQD